MATLKVQVVTPDGVVYDHNAQIVYAVTTAGQVGIMPEHIPLISPLKIDVVRVKRNTQDERIDGITVNGGILEVRDNVVSIISDSAERDRDIDVSRAEAAKAAAEAKLEAAREANDPDQIARLTVSLEKAINRIKVANGDYK
ncbi:MAG: F0F1 ATP synthase subunit epsilon [Lactobacillales bacterium]|jgi:F-type H+-transporting ATPase subunit epsilon|nr:F0F1 ATP synthase subunit epsilon [Lactobacillales bacterium]